MDNRNIPRRLVEHQDKFAVGKHILRFGIVQAIADILRNARNRGTFFAESLPTFLQECGAVLIREEKINFIDVHPGTFAFFVIGDHAIENSVEHDEHPHSFHLVGELGQVENGEAVVEIDIGFVSKDIQGAVGVKLDG